MLCLLVLLIFNIVVKFYYYSRSTPKNNKSPALKRFRTESHDSLKKSCLPGNDEVPKKGGLGSDNKKTKVTIIKTETDLSPEIKKARVPLTPATLSDLDGIDMMDLPVDFDESSPLSLDEIK